MQTFTLIFGVAIVAIAMEKFTAESFLVKNSDAGARGHQDQGIHSGNEGPKKYWLRGSTGEEKVIVTDGDESKEYKLNKTDLVLQAKSDEITISYINDKCCDPDRNVMFDTSAPKKISTAHNKFPQNYQENWNCSLCPDKILQNTTKRMKLKSRQERYDRCKVVRLTDDGKLTTKDDCDNCKILEEGQFCQPGNYTVVFRTQNQCKGVTFGECDIPRGIPLRDYNPDEVPNAKSCQIACAGTDYCMFYTFNNQTKVCRLLRKDYRKYCQIMTGPVDKIPTYCLDVQDGQRCDAEFVETCEYNGKDLFSLNEGASGQPGDCQETCKELGPDCKYWIHNKRTSECKFKRETSSTCLIQAGPKDPSYQFCRDQEILH